VRGLLKKCENVHLSEHYATNTENAIAPQVCERRSTLAFNATDEETMATPIHLVALAAARRSRLCAGLTLLQEALADAEELKCEKWEFAVSIRELLLSGLTGTDLRWLVSHGFLEHAVEQIQHRKGCRQFRTDPGRTLTDQSCFVLTEIGRLFMKERVVQLVIGSFPYEHGSPEKELPRWDAATRELTLRGQLVKRFRTPAHCQERILAVFEEEHWVARIDDPLEGMPGQDPQQRLHYAIRRLNGNQHQGRIRFSRDGTGKGICWYG